jgi:hypothetical protein
MSVHVMSKVGQNCVCVSVCVCVCLCVCVCCICTPCMTMGVTVNDGSYCSC